MQFKVPQFIDIEDKVFGPLTFKQFVYIAGGAGLAYLAWHFLPTIIAIVVAPAIAIFAVALAFMKYNDKPFINVVESYINFYSHARLYLWHKDSDKNDALTRPHTTLSGDRATMSESKLKTLSWSVDVIDPKK